MTNPDNTRKLTENKEHERTFVASWQVSVNFKDRTLSSTLLADGWWIKRGFRRAAIDGNKPVRIKFIDNRVSIANSLHVYIVVHSVHVHIL